MMLVELNLNNFFGADLLLEMLSYDDGYIFTKKKVFRRVTPPPCPCCGQQCVLNGFDYARKKNVGKVKLGKYWCKPCNVQVHEDKAVWKDLLRNWKQLIEHLIIILRKKEVSYDGIKEVLQTIFPRAKTTVLRWFNAAMEKIHVEPPTNIAIVHYDEQHPKRGRHQRFRLTLLDAKTGQVIADQLYDDKQQDTIEQFLRTHLPTDKLLVIITDGDRAYPDVFTRIWGKNLIHQRCLLHLNKNIVKDFGTHPSLQNMYNLYLLLNIFYNREKELQFLEMLLDEQQSITEDANTWKKEAKKRFYTFLNQLDRMRRRNKETIPLRTKDDARKQWETLWKQRFLLPTHAQKRLAVINHHWKEFTAFYDIPGCPATNNPLESYYAQSLKTHRKKQFRTDLGVLNRMKLSQAQRANALPTPRYMFPELIKRFFLLCI